MSNGPLKCIIEIDGERLIYREHRYIMMNKPAGFICATEDGREKTVLELLDERSRRQRLFAVGRLDKETEGLLIITNDGDFAHRIISPKSNITKRYYARVTGELNNEDVLMVRSGLELPTFKMPSRRACNSLFWAGKRMRDNHIRRQIPSGKANAR